MFRELKVSTGINIQIGLLFIFTIVISACSVTNSVLTDGNFKHVVLINENIDALNSSIYYLTTGIRRTNALMMDSALSHPVSDSDIASLHDDFSQAKKQMDLFMRIPFNTEAEKNKGNEIKKRFDDMLRIAVNKLDYIRTPAAYVETKAVEEQHATKVLSDIVVEYLTLSENLNANVSNNAIRNTGWVITLTMILLALSVINIIISRVWLKRSVFNRLEQTKEAFRTIATGNLNKEIIIGRHNEIGLMLIELEKMRNSLTQTISGIRHGVTNIYSDVREIASSNNDLSSRTEEQASALQQTAASMEELKITVRQNADNAHSAKQLAESASISAKSGGEVMINLDSIMAEITENSRQIAEINSVIDSIANQTNILALNAAVEAARAGEQGRGFAVVAGEVRNLAKRSADAAKEIRQLINTCVANMNTGSQEVNLAGKSMKQIVQSVVQVADIMAEITSASDEQSSGINQIAQAVNEMDLVTQQNAGMVELAAKTASRVEGHARDLDVMVSRFTISEDTHAASRSGERQKVPNRVLIASPVRSERPTSSGEEQWETF
ncbi:methyl-accepting chemotaxis protein [Enterobacter sp. DC4]|uniref:methyl-accepting chemotaxis protein n=1 Tax=Enterobacter sp. DC4 TaxID=1395580 RepID=UPI0004B97749|nr:methyl-accepting chemotaxis protein [Enterobacter sp. DC4]